MEPATAIGLGFKLPELGEKLADLVERASRCRVELKVLYYLKAAQDAICALGLERQEILHRATGCDIQDRNQVEVLCERMRIYLQQDNVRGPLKKAIAGLHGCRDDIANAAHGLKWRKQDKQEAVQRFVQTLDDLDTQAKDLVHNYFPEYSGQGLKTLVPIYDLIQRVRGDLRRSRAANFDAEEEELGELVRTALRDPEHDLWTDRAAHIERLIVDLQLAFSVKGGALAQSQ